MPVLLLTSHLSLLTAQSHAPIARFYHLRDSLAESTDTAALRSLLRTSRRQLKASRADVPAALRSGLLALRLGELGADRDFSDALTIFRRMSRDNPGSPEAWHGLGLAEQRRAQWEMSDGLRLGSRVGIKALERSAAAHRRALRADVTYTSAALALARIELSLLDTARLAVARA
ncbi:MAG TPA: hypothetical protein VFS51_00680, partial [Gemmatimonadales bacterium]|nr:hypothetical protein [Gemmatimonadales bacterium]